MANHVVSKLDFLVPFLYGLVIAWFLRNVNPTLFSRGAFQFCREKICRFDNVIEVHQPKTIISEVIEGDKFSKLMK